MSSTVLKLSSIWQPIETISWQDAITLWFARKAEIVTTYSDHSLKVGGDILQNVLDLDLPVSESNYDVLNIRSNDTGTKEWQTAMNAPAVIRLLHFVRPKHKIVYYKPFTRKNLFIRDGGRCQYCGAKLSLSSLTFEHVVPRSVGGLTRWENIVAACVSCNIKKRNRTPEEAGMRLLSKPVAPILAHDYNENVANKFKALATTVLNREEWKKFVYFNVELESE